MQMSFPQYGFSAPTAYLKVGDLQVSETSTDWGVNFTLKVYFSATAKSNGKALRHSPVCPHTAGIKSRILVLVWKILP